MALYYSFLKRLLCVLQDNETLNKSAGKECLKEQLWRKRDEEGQKISEAEGKALLERVLDVFLKERLWRLCTMQECTTWRFGNGESKARYLSHWKSTALFVDFKRAGMRKKYARIRKGKSNEVEKFSIF